MKFAVVILIGLALACAGGVIDPGGAQVISIEAESYSDSLDIGGVPIGVQPGPDCSGGFIVVGLDLAGEWIGHALPVETLGVYIPRIWCRGDLGEEYHFVLTLTPDALGGQQTSDFRFTGAGYG